MPSRKQSQPKEIEDNAIHFQNPERAIATPTQIALVCFAIVAILSIFFYGLNNQRVEEITVGPSSSDTVAQGPSQSR